MEDKLIRFRQIIHNVLSYDYLQPKFEKNELVTFCNIGIYIIINKYHNAEKLFFFNEKKNRIMTANEIYDWLKENKENLGNDYEKIPFNIYKIYIASQKGDLHGHVALIYPSKTIAISKKWGRVPLVVNVGKENGIMGLNWAFSDRPDIFEFGDL